ncbi:MAG: hypothetical protein PHU76_01655 [Synergistaceae bacterium]|nr:hypothetical protein [Proteiniphilum sp.]MDD3963145.1 hypothetical protein [Synergistaceae bacterium]
MTDKKKRTMLIAAGALLSLALIVGIASRFGGNADKTDPVLESGNQGGNTPVVDIRAPEETVKPQINVNINTGKGTKPTTDPGAGADDTGTEQTIQAAPAKPEAPEPPAPVAEDHGSEDVPEAERNTETPPTYKPEDTTVTTPAAPQGGSTNESGQMYVPGFGYVDIGSGNQGGTLDDMYESGEKVGVMD